MITSQLLHPASIVVVGASNNVHKPGGAILKNLLSGGYTGELRAVNPKETEVQGVAAFADVKDIPDNTLNSCAWADRHRKRKNRYGYNRFILIGFYVLSRIIRVA